jgi:hypothetical protein
MKNYYFFYSGKQADLFSQSCEQYPCNYATIDGKEVLYTSCNEKPDHGTSWDDMQHLGQGGYNRSCGNWQA